VGAGVAVGAGVGVRVGAGVGVAVGKGVGVRVGSGVAVEVGLGVDVGAEAGFTSPHQMPHMLFTLEYSWMVHIEVSSSGSTTVELKSPHLLSPVPKSLKYDASPDFRIVPSSMLFGVSLARRIEYPALG
jgi:hypothetical protein